MRRLSRPTDIPSASNRRTTPSGPGRDKADRPAGKDRVTLWSDIRVAPLQRKRPSDTPNKSGQCRGNARARYGGPPPLVPRSGRRGAVRRGATRADESPASQAAGRQQAGCAGHFALGAANRARLTRKGRRAQGSMSVACSKPKFPGRPSRPPVPPSSRAGTASGHPVQVGAPHRQQHGRRRRKSTPTPVCGPHRRAVRKPLCGSRGISAPPATSGGSQPRGTEPGPDAANATAPDRPCRTQRSEGRSGPQETSIGAKMAAN